MSDPIKPEPTLTDLRQRLEAAHQRSQERKGVSLPLAPLADPRSVPASGLAFRLGVDLVVATAVGIWLGFQLDRWLGSAPWGLLVMFFLGAAAGVRNVLGGAGQLQKKPLSPAEQDPSAEGR